MAEEKNIALQQQSYELIEKFELKLWQGKNETNKYVDSSFLVRRNYNLTPPEH
jgi:hypothetical protein